MHRVPTDGAYDELLIMSRPGDYLVQIPSYTQSISAAWEVVEKMKEGNWVAMRYQTYGWDIFDITPEAICLAALKAMGVDVQ